jgi:hypothetical protein
MVVHLPSLMVNLITSHVSNFVVFPNFYDLKRILLEQIVCGIVEPFRFFREQSIYHFCVCMLVHTVIKRHSVFF